MEHLSDQGVEFVLIGGVAAAALGSPSSTVDLDICYRRTKKNLKLLASALEGMGARLRGVDENDAPFQLHPKTLEAGDHFTLTTRLGDLDLIGIPAGTSGYADLVKQANEVDLGTLRVKVTSLEDLIRMKRAAGRPKDLIELQNLKALENELRTKD